MSPRVLTRLTSFVALTSLIACAAPSAPAEEARPPRAALTARAGTGAVLVRLPARVVVADARAVVAAPSSARVARVLVRPGDRVEKGAVIAEVVMPEVLAAAADLVASQERASAWERRAAQLKGLREAGLGRASDEAEAEVARAEAVASRARATASLRAAGVRPEGAQALLDAGALSLRSPRAGVVAQLGAVEGEVVAAGHALATVVGEGTAVRVVARAVSPPVGEATLWIGGRRAPLVTLAEVARVEGADGARELWFGVAPSSDDAALSRVLVDGALASVEVRVEGGAAVPAAAVALEAEGARVALLKDGAVVARDVVVRGRTAEGALVVDGIAPGDEVSLSPRAALAGAAP